MEQDCVNAGTIAKLCDKIQKLESERDALKAHVEQLHAALRHLHHNAKASGAEMGLALDVAEEALELSPQSPLAEQHPDDEAVNRFAHQMKCKLAIARSKGRSGWDNPDLCTVESLVDMLVEHLQKPNAGNWIDIANFCMMLHLRGANSWLLVNALAERDVEVLLKLANFMEEGFGMPMTMGCDEVREYAQRIKDGDNKC